MPMPRIEIFGGRELVVRDVLAYARKVVRHERVAPLHEPESSLALAHAGVALEEDAQSAYLDHRSVYGGAWRAEAFEYERAVVRQLARLECRGEDYGACLVRDAYLVAARLVAARVDDAQGLVLEERPYARETLVVRQRPQVCRLRVAEKLKPLPREMLEEPSEREPGPVDHGLVDLARKPVAADDNRKAKPLRAGFQKVGEGDLRDSGAP